MPQSKFRDHFHIVWRGQFWFDIFPLRAPPYCSATMEKTHLCHARLLQWKKNTPWFCQVVARSISPPAVRNILTRGKGIRRIIAQWKLFRLDQKPVQCTGRVPQTGHNHHHHHHHHYFRSDHKPVQARTRASGRRGTGGGTGWQHLGKNILKSYKLLCF